ncbi:MAG: SHOCT domain-containing protein [bacterium]|nr:SHOCT domain-containing protein [bacterium]
MHYSTCYDRVLAFQTQMIRKIVMSEAKRILDERLAKGEISEEEYDRILNKMSDTKVIVNDGNAATPEEISEGIRSLGKILLLLGGFVFAVLTIMLISMINQGQMMVGGGRFVWFLSGLVAAAGLFLLKMKTR